MAEEQLRIDALEYHEFPDAGKDLDRADQGARQPARPVARVFAGRRLRVHGDPGGSRARGAIHGARQPRRRHHQRHAPCSGLGNIGALAGKPVMEGKGCLFKKFAGIDVFDIEIGEVRSRQDRRRRRGARADVRRHQPRGHQGAGVLLHRAQAARADEDPGVPRRSARHGDRRGGRGAERLKIVGKDIGKVKLVCSGAGAAALACLNLQVSLGLNRGNIFVTDSKGVVYKGRKEAMDPDKERYAQDTKARTLDDIIGGADIFLGLSAGGVLTADDGQEDGGQADHPGDGESRAGDPAGARQSRRGRIA